MQQCVAKCGESEGAPQRGELGQDLKPGRFQTRGESTQWRHAEACAQPDQGPGTGFANQLLNRIGAQLVCERESDEPDGRADRTEANYG